jgi:hypothetical protein
MVSPRRYGPSASWRLPLPPTELEWSQYEYCDHSRTVGRRSEFRLQAGLKVFRRSRLLSRDAGIQRPGGLSDPRKRGTPNQRVAASKPKACTFFGKNVSGLGGTAKLV